MWMARDGRPWGDAANPCTRDRAYAGDVIGMKPAIVKAIGASENPIHVGCDDIRVA